MADAKNQKKLVDVKIANEMAAEKRRKAALETAKKEREQNAANGIVTEADESDWGKGSKIIEAKETRQKEEGEFIKR